MVNKQKNKMLERSSRGLRIDTKDNLKQKKETWLLRGGVLPEAEEGDEFIKRWGVTSCRRRRMESPLTGSLSSGI